MPKRRDPILENKILLELMTRATEETVETFSPADYSPEELERIKQTHEDVD